MKPIVKGMFARSLAGHDKGKLYVISDVQEPYVFLVDGKIRTANRPKKKKLIHVQPDYEMTDAVRDEDIRKALEALETGADFGQAVWNLFGNLNDTMNNMHRVIGEFEQTMHKQERNAVAAGGDCTGGESLEIRDGKLIVDLPANKGVVVYLTNE